MTVDQLQNPKVNNCNLVFLNSETKALDSGSHTRVMLTQTTLPSGHEGGGNEGDREGAV